MKPSRFDYLRAENLAEVHTALAENGGAARIIAGGQTLLPMLSMRLARPALLIDIMNLAELRQLSADQNSIRIGAGVRQAQVLEWQNLKQRQPLLAAALPWVGHAQTRSRGTICGSIAHADPSAEMPLTLLALDGSIELSSRGKRRSVRAEDFFTGMLSTTRGVHELIEAVVVPVKRPDTGCAFQEFGRRHGDFAIVACAAIVSRDKIRLAVGGVADKPEYRDFTLLEGDALDAALDAFAWELDARDDLHATAAYRRELVRRMGRATIEEARRCRA